MFEYRKKPDIVKAIQWWPECDYSNCPYRIRVNKWDYGYAYYHSYIEKDSPIGSEAFSYIEPGDYILFDYKGRDIVIKQDDFLMMYEPI